MSVADTQYDEQFQKALDGLKADGSYRHFAELERHAGKFPTPGTTAWGGKLRSGVPTTIWAWGNIRTF